MEMGGAQMQNQKQDDEDSDKHITEMLQLKLNSEQRAAQRKQNSPTYQPSLGQDTDKLYNVRDTDK